MIIVMSNEATEAQLEVVVKRVRDQGLDVNISRGTEHTFLGYRRTPLNRCGIANIPIMKIMRLLSVFLHCCGTGPMRRMHHTWRLLGNEILKR